MSKIQEKPLKETAKVKPSVEKKVKQEPAKPKTPAKAVLADKVKKNTPVAVEKKKHAETPKKVSRGIDKLNAHALKHISNWHAKAGADGHEFAKMMAKHARTLLK